jgi:hypothetical protein
VGGDVACSVGRARQVRFLQQAYLPDRPSCVAGSLLALQAQLVENTLTVPGRAHGGNHNTVFIYIPLSCLFVVCMYVWWQHQLIIVYTCPNHCMVLHFFHIYHRSLACILELHSSFLAYSDEQRLLYSFDSINQPRHFVNSSTRSTQPESHLMYSFLLKAFPCAALPSDRHGSVYGFGLRIRSALW